MFTNDTYFTDFFGFIQVDSLPNSVTSPPDAQAVNTIVIFKHTTKYNSNIMVFNFTFINRRNFPQMQSFFINKSIRKKQNDDNRTHLSKLLHFLDRKSTRLNSS